MPCAPSRRLLPRVPRHAAGHKNTPTDRVGILTPGPHNETYFEHAYIARYLGFMLLEGEDLTVEDGQVMVRTVAGPEADQRALAAHGRLLSSIRWS
jgi:uncharacterized circularly permuted ATP-grasp superfamily protein